MTKLISALLCVILACLPCAAMADTDLTSPLANKVATTIAIPYPAIPLTTISSSQYNANLATIASLLNGNLDSANVNLARGIGANYIVSSGAGVSGHFQAGIYSFTAQNASQTALSIQGPPSGSPGSAPIFQVCFNQAQAGNVCSVYVDQNGVLNTLSLNISSNLSVNQLTVNSGGMSVFGPTNVLGLVSITGQLLAQAPGASLLGYVPPFYTGSGSTPASTMQGITGSISCTSDSSGVLGASPACETSLTGIAFTDQTTYDCHGSIVNASATNAATLIVLTANSTQFYFHGTGYNPNATVNIHYHCLGT